MVRDKDRHLVHVKRSSVFYRLIVDQKQSILFYFNKSSKHKNSLKEKVGQLLLKIEVKDRRRHFWLSFIQKPIG